IEGPRAPQPLAADYETGVQHGPGGIFQLVPAGAATGLHRSRPRRSTTGCSRRNWAGIARVKSAKSVGIRTVNYLSARQAQALLNAPDITTLRGLRDRAIYAVLFGCGLG